jgi:hypothetical protein
MTTIKQTSDNHHPDPYSCLDEKDELTLPLQSSFAYELIG